MTPYEILKLIRDANVQLFIINGKLYDSCMDDDYDAEKYLTACYAVAKLPRKRDDIQDLIKVGA